jgi:hydroxymethylpyrimidine pyrophosphatase-like HAD family hydrolase
VVDVEDANRMMAERGFEFTLQDNGVSAARDAEGKNLHVYHLMPAGVDKPWGVRKHREAQGILRDEAVYVGDAITDLSCHNEVGLVCIMSNGVRGDANLAAELSRTENAIATTLPCAEGVEQVVELIARAKER